MPSHIALIPDGNRRWSSLHKLAIFNGYENGVKKFVDFSVWAKSFGVRTLTVWALSTENIRNRSKGELGVLYNLYVRTARDPEILEKLMRNGTRVNIIGNMRLLPANVSKALRYLESKTKEYGDITINLLIGYGGREDLMCAFRGACYSADGRQSHGAQSGDAFKQRMMSASIPDVDLVIRTSGEMRLSGFLPWQTDYSELYFAKKYWPDFERRDLAKALDAFAQRQRRFGK